MSYHQAQDRADAVIAAAERGDYDDALGIDLERRDLLNKAADPTQHLTLDDVRRLAAYGEHDAIATAHNADRVDYTATSNGDTQ